MGVARHPKTAHVPRLTRVLASVPERSTVTVELSVNYLDHAARQAISDWQRPASGHR